MENVGGGEERKSESSFTSLIFRTIPSCWRTFQTEVNDDEGGFTDFRTNSRIVSSATGRTSSDRYSSLPITTSVTRDSDVKGDYDKIQISIKCP